MQPDTGTRTQRNRPARRIMSLMISFAGPASLIIRGSPQTMRPDCMRTHRGSLNMVNMSIGMSPNSLALYRDLQAQQVPQKILDRLLDQTVGGIEEKNTLLLTKNEVLLEKQLVQGAAGTPAARTLHTP